jgi:DNA invertase Pin-like site-specific DNA recombinase
VSQRTDDSGQSPEVQRRALGQMSELHGWALKPGDVLDENVDNGKVGVKSGGASLADRPKLAHAVEQIEAGKAMVLAAENFDRLFRNLEVQREVVRRVEAAGGEVWERSGRISHARASDKFTRTIKGASSEFVKDAAAERSWDAVEIAIEQGRIPWHQTAPGYRRNPDSTLTPDDGCVPVIVKAFQMRRDGATIDAVRAYLRIRGIERSYHGTIHLLRDRIYVGEIHFGTHEPNLKAHAPIISRDLFDSVQRIKLPRGRRAKSERLLARLEVLRCASCGARMVVGTSNMNRYWIYRCPPTGDCKRRVTVSAELVEGIVTDAVRDALREVEGRAAALHGLEQAVADLGAAQRNYKAAMTVLDDFTDMEAVEKLRALKAVRDEAQAKVDQLDATSPVEVRVSADRDWERLTLEERRALIRATVDRVVVAPGRGADRVTVQLRG